MDTLGRIILSIIERLSSFRGKNVLPLYWLVHQKVSFIQRCPLFRVSFIQRCPLFRVSFIRGSTACVQSCIVEPLQSGQYMGRRVSPYDRYHWKIQPQFWSVRCQATSRYTNTGISVLLMSPFRTEPGRQRMLVKRRAINPPLDLLDDQLSSSP